MFSIERVEVPVPCPKCDFINPVTMRQVRIRDVVICRGCKSNLQLEDHLNEVRRGIRESQRAIKEFESALQELDSTFNLEV